MADLADVSSTLVGLISGLLYPQGTQNPSASGYSHRIFAGWPTPAQLDADLRAGIVEVNVYPRPEERNTTRYNLQWQQASLNTPTLQMTFAGVTITVSGVIPPTSNPHIIMAMVGYKPYVYAVQPSDTLASAASALAALIPGASSAGSVINCAPTAMITAARVGVTGVSSMEIRRQERLFQIGIWAPSPESRTATVRVIDPVLAITQFLNLPDLFAGRLIYRNSHVSDVAEKQLLFRRDLFYTVEYPTTQSQTDTQITQEELNVSPAPGGATTTIYI